MRDQITTHVTDTVQRIAIAAAGIVGVDNAEALASVADQGAQIAGRSAQHPDWIEPLIQGIIALATILIQLFATRRKKRLNDQV
tara:strand:+ start:232 stop:483 length:252 start_codon:yes stop_codon:yes gene_type:complete